MVRLVASGVGAMQSTIRRHTNRKEFLITVAAGAIVASCGGVLLGCGGRSLSDNFGAEPNPARVDKPFVVRFTGLSPGERVNMRLSMTDKRGAEWRSLATFEADREGMVDLAAHAPIQGSYEGKDPMGLLWSAAGSGYLYTPSLRPPPVTITAEVSEEETSIEVQRQLLTDEMESEEVREDSLYGRLFQPTGGAPAPGVLVLGGSDGGLNLYTERQAALLASHGFAALALAYFGADDLPERLADIPLEYFGRAIGWFKGREAVRGDRIGVVGGHLSGWGTRTPPRLLLPGPQGGGELCGQRGRGPLSRRRRACVDLPGEPAAEGALR